MTNGNCIVLDFLLLIERFYVDIENVLKDIFDVPQILLRFFTGNAPAGVGTEQARSENQTCLGINEC